MIVPGRFDLATLRAALWTRLALRRARKRLRAAQLKPGIVERPPPLPPAAERGLWAVLRRSTNTCLERAVVIQAWRAAHGDGRDVVIGVRRSGAAIEAHAWLDGEPDIVASEFVEIVRLPPT